jgi:hypothetical protein
LQFREFSKSVIRIISLARDLNVRLAIDGGTHAETRQRFVFNKQ